MIWSFTEYLVFLPNTGGACMVGTGLWIVLANQAAWSLAPGTHSSYISNLKWKHWSVGL